MEADEDIDRDIGDYLRHPVVKGVPIIPDRLPEIDARSGNPFDRFLFLLAATWGRVIQGQTKIVFLTHANNFFRRPPSPCCLARRNILPAI